MIKFESYLVNDFDTAENGNKAVGVEITIYNTGTRIKTALFEEDGSPKENPVTTSSGGQYSFWTNVERCDFVTDANTDKEFYLYTDKDLSSDSGNKAFIYEYPPFSGNEFALPEEAFEGNESVLESLPQVEINGRILPPSFYSLSEDNKMVILESSVTDDDLVVVRLTIQGFLGNEKIGSLASYDSVDSMILYFGASGYSSCQTSKFKKEVTSTWRKVDSGAGDMSDGTIALNDGGYAKIIIESTMSVRAFGAGLGDDTSAFNNAFALCGSVEGNSEDTYTLTDQVDASKGLNVFDGKGCKINWNGVAGNAELEGRDWGVLKIFGSFGDTIDNMVLSSPIPEFTETNYPTSNSQLFQSKIDDFVLMFAGSTSSNPELPSYSQIAKVVGITSFNAVAIDYRSGWEIPAGLSITYLDATPVEGVTLKNFTIEDISPDNEDRNKYASAISMSIASNCHVENVTGVAFRNPIVFGQYCTDCTSSYGRVERPQETGGGQGYHTQWSYSQRCDSHKLTGYKARHICDHTKSGYCNVTHCGDTNTADGAFTNHGAYEHDISYDNCVGWHSVANSGPSFGQSCARVNILHGNGSALTCGANVIDLSVSNSNFDRVLANSQGFQADGLTVGDVGFSLVSTTTAQGRDTLSRRPNVISNSSLYFAAGNVLCDFNFTGRVLYLNNTQLRNISSSIIGTGAVHMNGGSIQGSTAAISLGADASLKLTEVDTNSFGVRVLDGSNNSYFILNGGTHKDTVTTGIYSNRMQSGKSKLEIRHVEIDTSGGIIVDMPDVAGTNQMFIDINHNTFENGSIQIANRYSGDGKLFYTDNLEVNVTRNTDVTGGRRVVERNITVI